MRYMRGERAGTLLVMLIFFAAILVGLTGCDTPLGHSHITHEHDDACRGEHNQQEQHIHEYEYSTSYNQTTYIITG